MKIKDTPKSKYIEGVFIEADTVNKSGRIYPAEVVAKMCDEIERFEVTFNYEPWIPDKVATIYIDKDRLLENLYEACQDRSLTSQQVLDKLLKSLAVVPTSSQIEEALKIIRPYKNSGKNLETTVNDLRRILSEDPFVKDPVEF